MLKEPLFVSFRCRAPWPSKLYPDRRNESRWCMSEPNDTNANGQEPDSEVELTAEQLRALSVTSTSKEPQPERVTRHAELLVNVPASPSQSASISEAHGSQSHDHRSASVRVNGSLAIVVAVM